MQSLAQGLSFGNFVFRESSSAKKGGGIRELASQLKKARRTQKSHEAVAGTAQGEELHRQKQFETALQRASGSKIRDDPARLAKALAKRRNKKRKSAKQWAQRHREIRESRQTAIEDALAGKKTKRPGVGSKKVVSQDEKEKGDPKQGNKKASRGALWQQRQNQKSGASPKTKTQKPSKKKFKK